MASLSPVPKLQFFDVNGNPLVGGKLYTYAAGTVTPLATYTSSTGGTPNANPVILDARGEASVWLGTSLYYMELRDSTGALIWTADNVGGAATLSDLASTGVSSGIALIGNAIQRVTNIATLRTIAVTTNRDIATQGYYTTGDGGHGTYYGKTGAAPGTYVDNGGTIIVPTGGDGSSAWLLKFDREVSARQFGAKGDGATDDTAPIVAAIAAISSTSGGKVHVPWGTYKTTAQINVPSYVSIIGDGQFGGRGSYDQGGTTILGIHSGNAVVCLVGSVACRLSDICIQSGPTSGAYPKTGLMLGRTTVASAGYHKIIRTSVYGNYAVAAVFSVASEDNYWEDLNVWLYGGGAKWCLYTSIGNSFPAITQPLYTQSNLDNVFVRTWMANSSTDVNASCIYIDGAQAVGSWTFLGGYLTAYAGSYVTIANGYVDGLSMIGPITFIGVSGEILSGGDPLYGFNLTASIAATLPELTIIGCRLSFLGGANHYQISQSANLTLSNPNISIKPPEAAVYAQCLLQRDKISGGTVSVGRFADWTDATLNASWVATYGAPYPVPGFRMDATGRVSMRGTVSGTSGSICTLPAQYRPLNEIRIPTFSNGAAGLLRVDPTGDVWVMAGSTTAVELSPINFVCTE